MKTPDGVFLSPGCPATGNFVGPLTPENFWLTADNVGQRDTYQFVGEFLNDESGGTATDIGADVPNNSLRARDFREIASRYTEHELGQYFCSKVAECQGPEMIDGPPHCPALNNMQLRRLL